jgi:hypothetical protein
VALFPTPREYSSLAAARLCAFNKWGSAEESDRLSGLLISNDLRAAEVDRHGKKIERSADFWENNIQLLNDLLNEPRDTHRIEYVEPKSRIVFLTADLDRVFATPPAADQNYNSPAADRKSNGGRPEEIDWEAMWIEMIRIVFVERIDLSRDKRAALKERMLQWFEDRNLQVPGDSAMKKKMAKLFNIIDSSPR